MLKKILNKIIKFLDKHRLILVILILIVISILFIVINSLLFLNHNFKSLKCTKNIDEIYCYNNDLKIFKNPEQEKEKFFQNNKDDIEKLQKDYNLSEFNYYTAYFYEQASRLEMINSYNEELFDFFYVYSNTYQLANFYQKYNLYFDLFYHNKND